MSILKVARLGHPAVRRPAQPVAREAVRTPEVQRLIDDMIETMHEYDGVGLAAPQVHVGLRLAVIEVPAARAREEGPQDERRRIHSDAADDERSEAGVPLTVLVNPVVTPLGSRRVAGYEGCLSVPDLRGLVRRLDRLRLEALDRQGKAYSVEASGFFARVIQHECDHLEGRVYLDRMDDLRSLSFLREFERFGAAASPEDEEQPARSRR
jgi:peptide deformylase